MKTSENRPFVYEKHQLIETICQLRFPTILSIETKEPADFQDTVRAAFPNYSVQMDPVKGPDGKPAQVKNYSFISDDGTFKLSLTKDFIALSTMRYPGWESFARTLDEPLGQFIRVYQPAFFQRVGLRFVNAFSREKLELTGRRWNDLLQPQYLSVLDDDAVDEADVAKCAVDIERRLDERCALKLHAGPGKVTRSIRGQTIQEPETRFVLDLDVYTTGRTQLGEAAETLEQLHDWADRQFSEAITDVLHEALEPVEI